MSISSTTNRNDYTGNGAVDTYSYTFRIFANTDLLVTVRDTNDVETTLTLTTHYTVSGVGDAGGGSISLVNGAFSWLDADGDLKSNYILTIRRVRPLKQETDIRNQGDFFPETHEDAFDHLLMIDQQQQDEIDRAVVLPETVPSSEFNPQLPSDIGGAVSKVPLTNTNGNGWANAADWPTSSQIANAQTHATNAATSATNAATSATNAAASATAAAASVSAQLWQDVVFKTSSFSVVDADRGKMFACDCSGGAITVTLPQISGLTLTDPWAIGIKKTDSSGNAITINRAGTDTIDGLTSKTISSADAGAVLIPDTDTAPDEWTSAEFGASAGNMTVDRFSGNGATVAFTLSVDPGSENNTWVYVSGVYQQKDTYSVSGTTLTFSSAPPTGTNNIEVIIGTSLSIGTPSDSTVSTAKIVDDAVTLAKMEHGTQGDVPYYGASGAPARLSAGTVGQSFQSGGAGANPSWGNSFVSRGDPAAADKTQATLTINGTWVDWDLSSIVPAGAKAVLLGVEFVQTTADVGMFFRRNGNSNEIARSALRSQVANVNYARDVIVALDSNRVIEYFIVNTGTWTNISITVCGWWF